MPFLLASASGRNARALAQTLFRHAGGETVRVVEAVAAVLVNRAADAADWVTLDWGRLLGEAVEAATPPPLAPGGGCDTRLAVCARIARRAVRRSLRDPTAGATAFHRVGDRPTWAAGRLLTAEIGPLLFYRDPRPGPVLPAQPEIPA